MTNNGRKYVFPILAALPFIALTVSLKGYSSGSDPRFSGAPGDGNCTSCHFGTAVNSTNGSVKIVLPGGNTYTPGVKQRVRVEIADSTMRRWGFQLSARVASKPDSAQAGLLESVDGNAQIVCDSGAPGPCRDANEVQFATHTTAGTRTGTTGSIAFELDWTPPATDVGPVRLYVAGNATNGNLQPTGDRVYTSNVELAVAGPAKPTITEVMNQGSRSTTDLAANTWIAITGTGLATASKSWSAESIVESKLPTEFEGVSVTVNNKPAFVQSVSAEKIIALTPNDDAVGPVEVKVTSAGQVSDAKTVELKAYAPAVMTYDGKKVAFNRADEAQPGTAQPFPAEPKDPKTAKPGETILLFGTGLGATETEAAEAAITAGVVPENEAPLAKPVKVTIGGTEAMIGKAVLLAKLPRIYGLQVTVPEALTTGDHAVVVEIEGQASRSGEACCFLSVAVSQPDTPVE